jgi:uncharacterized protein YjbI with pentapeptide repeats
MICVQQKAVIAAVLLAIGLVVGGVWFWGVLFDFIGPKNPTERKDLVQVFAFIVAGVVGAIGAVVGLANLYISRRNLEQQRELEDQRGQDDALQAYFQQMGDLLTQHKLIETERDDDPQRLLARAHTLTVSRRLDASRKGLLLRFLRGAGLIYTNKTIVRLSMANLDNADLSPAFFARTNLSGARLRYAILHNTKLREADLSDTSLRGADLSKADLSRAVLKEARLIGTDLTGADLTDADLTNAHLTGAVLEGAKGITNEELAQQATSLNGATMPNGQKYEDWLKDREGRGEGGKNKGSS